MGGGRRGIRGQRRMHHHITTNDGVWCRVRGGVGRAMPFFWQSFVVRRVRKIIRRRTTTTTLVVIETQQNGDISSCCMRVHGHASANIIVSSVIGKTILKYYSYHYTRKKQIDEVYTQQEFLSPPPRRRVDVGRYERREARPPPFAALIFIGRALCCQ